MKPITATSFPVLALAVLAACTARGSLASPSARGSACVERAASLYDLERYGQALESLDAGLALERDAELLLWRGKVLMALDRRDEAEASLEAAIEERGGAFPEAAPHLEKLHRC